jgi:arylsulfatase A-like enzyme
VLARLQAAGLGTNSITIVTSDHGEFLGEQRLLAHGAGLGEAVLHVPLVVHGVHDAASGVIDAPVSLADLLPSLLSWTGTPAPESGVGRVLPTRAAGSMSRGPLTAEFLGSTCEWPQLQREAHAKRFAHCTANDLVRPDGFAAIQIPHLLLRFPGHPSRLFDLRSDRIESEDIAQRQPAIAAALESTLDGAVAAGPPKMTLRPTVGPETTRRLRMLGYLGGPQPTVQDR